MATQVLSKPKTYIQAIEQLQGLWGQWPYHFSFRTRDALEGLGRTFLEFARRDLETTRNWAAENGKQWWGMHRLTYDMTDQDGCYSYGTESVEIDEEEVRLIISKGENDDKSILIITLAPLGTELRRVEQKETIEKLGEEPVTVAHLMITFKDNRIFSFQEERFWEMANR